MPKPPPPDRGVPRGGPWVLAFNVFRPSEEGTREALCTLANGYWSVRGAAPEVRADSVHYPGVYLAGVYNRLTSTVHGRSREDEHLVNAPNWLPLEFRVQGGEWFSPSSPGVLEYRQELDLYQGVLTRRVRWRDAAGHTTRITSRRFVSQAHHHLAALETTFVAEDWSGTLTVRSSIDGAVRNGGVAEYRLLAGNHLDVAAAQELTAEAVLLETVTNQSAIRIAVAARTDVRADHGGSITGRSLVQETPAQIGHELVLAVEGGVPVTIDKVAAVSTSRDRAISTPALAVAAHLEWAGSFGELLDAHAQAWASLWERFGIEVRDGPQVGLALTLNSFHVLQTLSTVAVDVDAGAPARGRGGCTARHTAAMCSGTRYSSTRC